MLSNWRNKNLRKNIPLDQQILALNREEMEIKREMLKKNGIKRSAVWPFYGSISRKHVHLNEYPFTVNTNDDCNI